MANSRIRRKKHVSAPGATIPTKKVEYFNKLAETSEDLALQVLEIQKQISDNTSEMLQHLMSYSLDKIEANYGDYLRETPKGRSSTVVDVVALKDRLDDDEFVECISASVSKVRKLLSQKEMDDISTTTPGKDGDPRVVYKPRKR